MTVLVYAFVALLAMAVLFGLGVLVLPRGEQLSPPVRDLPRWDLAEAPMTGEDVVRTRLPVGWRGYRFDETDLLLDRLADELRARDLRIAELEGRRVVPDAVDARGMGNGDEDGDGPVAATVGEQDVPPG